jgi:hypothetical protein
MLNGAVKDIGDRLYPTVRVPRETPEIFIRLVIPEIVQQQERIKLRDFIIPESPFQVNTRAFKDGLGFEELFYGTGLHGWFD